MASELNDAGTGWRYPTVILSVPRRAGKTTLVLAANLERLDVIDDARCWYTAQRRETAAKLYRDEWCPMIERLGHLYRLRRSQGSEGIHKRRGSSRLQLFAPTADALHSTNADTVTVDEAWGLSLEQGEAIDAGITPAQLTRPWAQKWIVSAGGTESSVWWDRWLTAGEGGLPGVALFDFGADPTDPAYDPSDPAVWQRSHPTAGVAFGLDVLEREWLLRSSDAEFERAYLNVWPRPSTLLAAGGVDLELWAAAARPELEAERWTALAFDIAADRASASLAAAGPAQDGRTVVEVVEHRSGTAWLPDAVLAARAGNRGALVVADNLVAASVTAELERRHVTVLGVGATDAARACGAFTDRLAAGRLLHRSQAVLDGAVLAAARRPLGDAWLWSRARSSADISPLVAATLASWSAATHRTAGRPAVVTAANVPR